MPLLLTFLRIAAIPPLVVILLSQFQGKEIISFTIFLLATLTDIADGVLAREKNQTTVLGELLDPTADKLLVASVLICLVKLGTVPAWMAVVIISRELAISGFRAVAASKNINIAASRLGKIKMTLEIVTICGLLLGEKILGSLFIVPQIGLWLVMIAAIVSAAEYYMRYGPAVISAHS